MGVSIKSLAGEDPEFWNRGDVTLSGLFTVPYFCRSFSINLSAGDNTCLR